MQKEKIKKMKSINKYDKVRYEKMLKLIKSDPNGIALDIGGGLYSILENLIFKKKIILDGEKKFNPDLLVDLNKKIPLKDNFANLIVAGEIIEHLINPFRFLLDLNRILKKEGQLVISIPNIASLKNRFKLFMGELPSEAAQAFPSLEDHYFFHKADYTLKRILELLEESGYTIKEVTNTGIFLRNRLIISGKYCPLTLGEKFVIKAIKK